MREQPARILEGVRILRHLAGAERVLIGVEDNKGAAISALVQALAATDLQQARFQEVIQKERKVLSYLFNTSSRISMPFRTSPISACDPMCPILNTFPASCP